MMTYGWPEEPREQWPEDARCATCGHADRYHCAPEPEDRETGLMLERWLPTGACYDCEACIDKLPAGWTRKRWLCESCRRTVDIEDFRMRGVRWPEWNGPRLEITHRSCGGDILDPAGKHADEEIEEKL
jgi:hypothetical protein